MTNSQILARTTILEGEATSRRHHGLTLLELVVVLTVLVALAAIIVPTLTGTSESAQSTVAQANLRQLEDLIIRYRADNHRLPRPGFADLNEGRVNAPQLRYLFLNPGAQNTAWPGPGPDPTGTAFNTFDATSRNGWNGPYFPGRSIPYRLGNGFTNEFGVDGDPALPDVWGRAEVLVTRTTTTPGLRFTWLQSAGLNGVLEVPPDGVLTGAPYAGVGQPGVDANTVFPGWSSSAVDDVTLLLPISE